MDKYEKEIRDRYALLAEQEIKKRKNIKTLILNNVSDLMLSFLVYDRREDPDLKQGAIEDAIISGEITIDEIINGIRKEIEYSVAEQQKNND